MAPKSDPHTTDFSYKCTQRLHLSHWDILASLFLHQKEVKAHHPSLFTFSDLSVEISPRGSEAGFLFLHSAQSVYDFTSRASLSDENVCNTRTTICCWDTETGASLVGA